ncbi:myosin-binding protein 7 isoform X3 [Andrographis paniculata]|nr:myosin-binding protein 7 isoform X3 [Andrographis paniculata]
MVMSEAEIRALKEALCNQQELLQKLYSELDAEREASATAASEALSVILRLQGEKAAVKMEAEQYKRLAEERMCHAEESVAVIEDIIQERDMEVAALDYQVQTYRSKLLSMGLDVEDDSDGNDLKSPDARLRNETPSGDNKGFHGGLQRRFSEPMLVKYKKTMADTPSTSPKKEKISGKKEGLPPKGQETNLSLELEKKADSSTHGNIDSYGEKIKKLSVRVKKLTGDDDADSSRNETRSPPSLPSGLNFGDPSTSKRAAISDETEQNICPANSSKDGGAADGHGSPSIHDVFEVPQADESCSTCRQPSPVDLKMKKACRDSETHGSKEVVHPEAVKLYAKEEHDWLKKLFQSTHDEKHLCKPSNIAAIDRAVREPSTSIGEPPEAIDCAKQESTTGIAEPEGSSSQSNLASVIHEAAKRLAQFTRKEEELKLLKEINRKLDLLRADVRSQRKDQKPPVQEDRSSSLPEAMLYFWL